MKDFVKATLVLGAMLALVLGARVALFAHLHGDIVAVKNPTPITAADTGCGVMAIKMPCFRSANPEGLAVASVPRESGSANTGTIAAQDTRCAARHVKMPCFQRTESRS